jgi:pantoate--beta-alanine ligase
MEAATPGAETEPASPDVIRDLAALRAKVAEWHGAGEKVAVVPTMGALHEGHLTLAREGKRRAQRAIVTISINPKQFAPTEDLDRYPRDEAGDLAKLASVGADIVYAPLPNDV